MTARQRDLACLVALASLDGIGPATLLSCLSTVGPEEAWVRLSAGELQAVPAIEAAAVRLGPDGRKRLIAGAGVLEPDAVLERHLAAGQRVVAYGQQGYPDRLLTDPAPPAVLFSLGDLSAVDSPTVAIIGTRNCTRLGHDTAAALASELAEVGVSVVSGLALGIDGAAHAAIVRGGAGESGPDRRAPGPFGIGRAIGVVATGLDRAYPRRHALLHRQVADHGALISECPIGSATSRWRFPARNRIIAGLADAVIVVESRSAGGSMVTANEALVRDVPILAVPGHPTSPAAAGPLDLICDGAMPVRDVDDVLVAIGLGGRATGPSPARSADQRPRVDPLAGEVLEHLGSEPRTLGELVVCASSDLEAVSAALLELEQAGLVSRTGAWFEQRAPVEQPARSRAKR